MPQNQLISQARHDTLTKLNTLGLRLEWDSHHKVLTPGKEIQLNQDQDVVVNFYEELSDQIDRVSNETLISSLLAGPDNESDESIDLVLFLGRRDSISSTSSLLDWSLEQLGVLHDQIQNIVIRERVEEKVIESKKEEKTIASECVDKTPWILERIYKTGRMSTESNDLIKDSSLEETLSHFKPRIHFEFQNIRHPSIVVCLFIGQFPILLPSASHNPLYGGLISYRVES